MHGEYATILLVTGLGMLDKSWFALIEAFALNMGSSCLRQKWNISPQIRFSPPLALMNLADPIDMHLLTVVNLQRQLFSLLCVDV